VCGEFLVYRELSVEHPADRIQQALRGEILDDVAGSSSSERLCQVLTPHLGTPWQENAIYGDFQVVDRGDTGPDLAVDATGVGRGVVDLLRSYGLDYQEAYRAAPSRRVAVVLTLVGGFN
jgi:hypothetical protein